jgi:hypothetical protein
LHVALVCLAARLDRANVRWWVAGSAARALAGQSVRPHDLDIEVAVTDAQLAGLALGITLQPESGGGWSSLRGHGRIARVPIDVSAGMTVAGPGGVLHIDEQSILSAAGRVACGGYDIALLPPEEAYARAVVCDDVQRRARLIDPATLRADYVARRLASASAAR